LLDLLHGAPQFDHILSQLFLPSRELLLASRELFEALAYGRRILRHCFQLRRAGRGCGDRFRSGRFRHLWCRWGHLFSRDVKVGWQTYQG
jgi:hypothetical protein